MGKPGVERPRWRCGEPDCPASERWQPLFGVNPGDLDKVLAVYSQHYRWAHPVAAREAPEVTADVA